MAKTKRKRTGQSPAVTTALAAGVEGPETYVIDNFVDDRSDLVAPPWIPVSVDFSLVLNTTTTDPLRYPVDALIDDSGTRTLHPQLKSNWFQGFMVSVLRPLLCIHHASLPAGQNAFTFDCSEREVLFYSYMSEDDGIEDLRRGSLVEHLTTSVRQHGQETISVYIFVKGISQWTVTRTQGSAPITMLAHAGVDARMSVPAPSTYRQCASGLQGGAAQSSSASRSSMTDTSAPSAFTAVVDSTSCSFKCQCGPEPCCYIKKLQPHQKKRTNAMKCDSTKLEDSEKLFFYTGTGKDRRQLNFIDVFNEEGFRKFERNDCAEREAKGQEPKPWKSIYSSYVKDTLTELLHQGKLQAKTMSGDIGPLLPDFTKELVSEPQYGATMHILKYSFTSKKDRDASIDFQITVRVCVMCKRIHSIIWNRCFEPIARQDFFDLKLESEPIARQDFFDLKLERRDLEKMLQKLLTGVERNPSTHSEPYAEPFAELPLGDDGQPLFTFERAQYTFSLAEKAFLRGGAQTKVKAPVIVGGDVHGESTTLRDLLLRSENLEIALVLLGDIGDRGENSVWVVWKIALLKVLYPELIYLIRGNHETRGCEADEGETTLFSECHKRFGERGKDWFDMIHRLFNCLPYAISLTASDEAQAQAVEPIDPIICLHAGPSEKYPVLNTWDDIPRESLEKELHDVMWSDPDPTFEGHYAGSERGPTCKTFGRAALEDFLDQNLAQAVIRGHGAPKDGCDTIWDNSVITVESAHSHGTVGACLRVQENLHVNTFRWRD